MRILPVGLRGSSSRNVTVLGTLNRARCSRTWARTCSAPSRAPRSLDDERGQHLAELGVGHADDGGLVDLRVVVEQLLDLGREHVLAAGHDHVVVAAVDEQVAVGVEVAHVARRQQAALLLLACRRRCSRRSGRALPTKIRPVVPAGSGCGVVVEDLDAHARRPTLPTVVGWRRRSAGRGDAGDGHLGRAVGVVHDRTEAVGEVGGELAAERRAADGDDLQRRRVDARRAPAGRAARIRRSITGTATRTRARCVGDAAQRGRRRRTAARPPWWRSG